MGGVMLGLLQLALFLLLPSDYRVPNATLLFWCVEGASEADRDIRENRMRFKLYGHMAGHTQRDKAFTRLMKDRFDVEVQVIGQCVMEIEQVVRADAYNARIERHIESRFGRHTIRNLFAESAEWYQQPQGQQVLAICLLGLNVLAGWFVLSCLRGRLRSGCQSVDSSSGNAVEPP